ncbi:sulfurtransferase TusA family protein [Niveispirillum fermenti]|uniref:sulfurtransferase TusA family protein n=1 Tax=Niveispirillum fermenti TaxID=1233113 RepID=UPI0040422F51
MDSTGMQADLTLDCTGLKCPMPVLRAAKALRAMQPGQILHVTATDKAAQKDFATFCREGGHILLGTDALGPAAGGDATRFRIRRGGHAPA